MNFWQRIKSVFSSAATSNAQQAVTSCQRVIGYSFANPELLYTGLSHRSVTQINGYQPSNERLEFLGDSVLGLVIAAKLYHDYPDANEGDLTKLKAMLVNEATLSMVAIEIGLNEHILLSPDEEKSGGKNRPSIVSDAFESVIGAVFLDGGLSAAREVVLRTIYARHTDIVSDSTLFNFKGELLEWSQAKGRGLPTYQVISEEGPDHDKKFRVAVSIGEESIGRGEGCSKKEAEQHAAKDALTKLGVDLTIRM